MIPWYWYQVRGEPADIVHRRFLCHGTYVHLYRLIDDGYGIYTIMIPWYRYQVRGEPADIVTLYTGGSCIKWYRYRNGTRYHECVLEVPGTVPVLNLDTRTIN